MPIELLRYRIDYRQGGKNYRYFISANNAAHAKQIFDHDTQDEQPIDILNLTLYGVL